MGVRDDAMTGNHYKVQKDYYSIHEECMTFNHSQVIYETERPHSEI